LHILKTEKSLKLLSDKVYRKFSSGFNRRQSVQDSLQMINNNTGYQLWNLMKWKRDSNNTSNETLDENFP
jgi:hypothetical protein